MIKRIVLMLSLVSPATSYGITVEDLADVFDAMESAILDVSIEYEWYNDRQETADDIQGTNYVIPVTREICEFRSARPFKELQLHSSIVKLMDERASQFTSVQKVGSNGGVVRELTVGGLVNGQSDDDQRHGTITKRRSLLRKWNLTPMAFTILRDYPDGLLSTGLRDYPEAFRVAPGAVMVRGFSTVVLEFVSPTNQVHRKLYLSVEHAYAPVRYEFFGGNSKALRVEVDVLNLEEVVEGVWFPVKGTVGGVDEVKNVYEAKKVQLNQGLTKDDFTFEFPPGTQVVDEIANVQYVVRPSEEQFNPRQADEQGLAGTIRSNTEKRMSQTEVSAAPNQSVSEHPLPEEGTASSADSAVGTKSVFCLIGLTVATLLIGHAFVRARR